MGRYFMVYEHSNPNPNYSLIESDDVAWKL